MPRRLPRLITIATSALVAMVIVVTGFLGAPDRAEAHPLGNFTINRYARIEVYREVVRILYVLDMAEIPSFQELGTIDANNNGASAEELSVWADQRARATLPGLQLSLDGAMQPLEFRVAVASSAPGQSNLPVLRLEAIYDAVVPAHRGDEVALRLRDTNLADRVGWREIVIEPSRGAEVVAPEGYRDRSFALRGYPATSLEDAPNETEVSFHWTAGTGAAAPSPALEGSAPAARSSAGFAGLLDRDRSPLVLAATLAAAAGFGMLHAFGPGHGKAIVAAYLVGNRGTARHAIGLGVTVTATHTAAVYLLGGVTIVASHFILPERLYLSLAIVSGLLITAFGAMLLFRRLTHVSGDHVHVHDGGNAGAHVHAHGSHAHPHGDTAHEAATSAGSTSWRSVLALGMVGGMLPCPSAIVVMLAAISVGQVWLGLLLIIAFSFGLAAVLTALGLAIVSGQRLGRHVGARHLGALERLRTAALARTAWRCVYVGSPVAIMLIGCYLTLEALQTSSIPSV